MNYLTLYRQWRPQTFGEVVGQKNTVTGLRNAVREGKLAHAYLFFGPRGSGKTSVAKILAKAVNCLNPDNGEPCNACPACRDINNGSFMDVLEIDAASNRGIDEIRDLREKVRVLPAQGKKKVYIIDEVHMLTTEAFNALLKTLEEPPDSVIFILATTEVNRVPATVLSRCQRYAFTRLSISEVTDRLRDVAAQMQINVTDKALELMARRSNGSLRDALSIMEQCIAFRDHDIDELQVMDVLGLVNHEVLAAIFKGMMEQTVEEVIVHLNSLIKQGKEPVQIARDAALCARDLMQYTILNKNADLLVMPAEEAEEIISRYPGLTASRLSQVTKHLLKLADELRFNEGQRFVMEVGFLEAMEFLADLRSGADKAPVVREPGKQKKQRRGGPDPSLKWEEVMEKVKSLKVTTHALLVPAVVLGLADGVVTLGYRPELKFHREKMEEKANQEVLRSALEEVLGHPVEVELVTLEETAEQPQVVRKAIEIFGKDKVKIIE
ncbi:MAG: DNA polymerase III subunit gamma/tau [Syntrophomonadaceae bacterium]|nr:DNA polymerase III subunit gamma/tau [Syntrophomonadaceae bacterium]